MGKLIAVALGGAIGAILRYSAYIVTSFFHDGPAPLATWSVNLAGCLMIGFLAPTMGTVGAAESWRLFALVGFLGSFTTFSTFSFESVVLLEDGQIELFLLNALGSVITGILFVWAGLKLHVVFFE